MINFEGKKVVVSGGGAGIGLAIVDGFVKSGAQVAVIEKDEARLSSLLNNYPSVLGFHGDVTSDTDVTNFQEHVAKTFPHVDSLINNVGDFLLVFKKFEEQSNEEINNLFEANMGHVFRMTRAFLPLIRQAKGDRSIVSIASIEAHRAIPNASIYSSFKTGLTGFTKSLALELGPEGVRINLVAPETTNTVQVPLDYMVAPEHHSRAKDLIPLKRFGRPEDTAGAVFYLCSSLASWVTGTTIHVDGGALAAAGWYRDHNDVWTNMPIVTGNALNIVPEETAAKEHKG